MESHVVSHGRELNDILLATIDSKSHINFERRKNNNVYNFKDIW